MVLLDYSGRKEGATAMACIFELSGAGSVTRVEPIGIIDVESARTLIETVRSLSTVVPAVLVEIGTSQVAGLTKAACRLLTAAGFPAQAFVLGDDYVATSAA